MEEEILIGKFPTPFNSLHLLQVLLSFPRLSRGQAHTAPWRDRVLQD